MQTKNVNVVQPPATKIEKNAVAAAANQNSSIMNGIAGSGSSSTSSGISSIGSNNVAEHNHAQLQNGSVLNGISSSSSSMGGGLLQNNSSDSSNSSMVVESTVTIPGVNGTTMTVSAINGMNMGLKSPYQYLHLTSPSHVPPMASHQHSSASSHQHISTNSSPYQPLPITPKTHLMSPPSSAVYQHVPVTSSQPVTSPYMPPPLPPRVGSSRPHLQETPPSHHSTSAPGTAQHSVYKPVPPPKPFVGPEAISPVTSGTTTAPPSGSQQPLGNKGPAPSSLPPPPVPFHQSTPEQLREQLAVVTGSTLQSCGTPPVLSHILVTDQGQFHTHSSKFPIEVKEAPARLYSTEPNSSLLPPPGPPPPPRFTSGSPFLSGSVTLSRGLTGISGLAGMGTAKGSTLPRSRVPSLADLRPPPQAPFGSHVHPHIRHNTVGEDREHLVHSERQARSVDGIDNPTLLDDSHMPVYRSKGVGGGPHSLHPSGIPAEGTLAGALPAQVQPRPYESPFTSRPPFHSSQPPLHQQNASHQSKFTRETWLRNSQEQRGGIVELHPQQGHIHMNGHGPHHPIPPHMPNNSHGEGHHNIGNSHSTLTNGDHAHLNGRKDNAVNGINQNNRTSAVDENHVNGAHEQRNEARKDDKWGSLTRGIAAKKYQNLKEKLSSKFTKSDKPEERTNNSSFANEKNSNAQNTNSQHTTASVNGIPDHTEGKPQPGSSRDSFRRAVLQSSQNHGHQENIMETNLSSHHPEGLPPQYPRPPQPVPASSHSHSSYQTGVPTHHSTHHHHDSVARGMLMRRSGSYHHLSQHHQETPAWRSHHYSVDNLVDSQVLPSDHTYSGPAVTGSRGQPAGSGGSDSGRGPSSVGNDARVPNPLDTSLDSATSQRHNAQGHSSGNDSEWVDMTDTELQRIMRKGSDNKTGSRLTRRESLAATPPLPPLSPEGTPSPSPRPSPTLRSRKHSLSYSCGGLNKPDLLEAAEQEAGGPRGVGEGRTGNSSQGSSQSTPRRPSNSHIHHSRNVGKTSTGVNAGSRSIGVSNENWTHRKQEERRGDIHNPHSKSSNRVNLGPNEGDLDAGEITSTTDALDLDSMLDGGVTEATSDDDATSAYDPDVHLIRKQLEGLEGMYSEVLKLLGGRRGGRGLVGSMGGNMLDSKASRRRMHGSLSSLPSSIVSSRPGREKRRVIDDRVRKIGRDNGGKTIHKRFQRLESHVVTLARSVAHLSSEMRTQHLMLQEIESIRGELSMLRTGGNTNTNSGGHGSKGSNHISWESFKAGIPSLSNPGRVKKLTQFFGDEPPLVRIFLRKLGYEKYAGLFEQEKIGMLELPYLSEERLQKIGIPMGPRLRILQEAQGPIRKDGNLSVYVV